MENEDNNLSKERRQRGSSAGNFLVKCHHGSWAAKLGRNESSNSFTQEVCESTEDTGFALPNFYGVSLPLQEASFSMSMPHGKKEPWKGHRTLFPETMQPLVVFNCITS